MTLIGGSIAIATCTNCEGTGTATYVYGPPGTDRHTPASEVEWEEPRHRECRACDGTGQRKQSRHGPVGKVWFKINGDVDQERTVNERNRQSRAKGNQGWLTSKK